MDSILSISSSCQRLQLLGGNEIGRATVIEDCATEKIRCVETDLTLDNVYGEDEMFCTGTMGELALVIKVDDRPDRRWQGPALSLSNGLAR